MRRDATRARRIAVARVLAGSCLALSMIGAAPAPAGAFAVARPVCVLARPAVLDAPCPAPPAGGARVRRALLGGVGRVVGGVARTLMSPVTAGAGALAGIGLAAIGTWVLGGARAALDETATIISRTTAPHLEATWFSSTYWRVAGLATLLTLPFLFAAGVQALVRSDLGLLVRAALGYLPLAMLGVSLAAPIVMLLLAATDQMSAVVAGPGVDGGVRFLNRAALGAGTESIAGGSAFFLFLVGILTVAAALALMLELLIREAAVYVVVLMLPLAFAALVWPARRIWAVRMVEVLVALILSKFVIVAVLSLAGAAFGADGSGGVGRMLTAMALVLLSTLAPWGLMRLLPFTELAAGTAGALRGALPGPQAMARPARDRAESWASSVPVAMRRLAHDAGQGGGRGGAADGGAVDGGAVDGGVPGRFAAAAGAAGAPGPRQGALDGSSLAPSRAPAAVTGDLPGAGGDPGPGGGPGPDGGPDGEASAPRERLPGFEPIYQAENGSWAPLWLGPGEWAGPSASAPAPSPPDPKPPLGENGDGIL
jgi:hypothetical protein